MADPYRACRRMERMLDLRYSERDHKPILEGAVIINQVVYDRENNTARVEPVKQRDY